MAKWKYVVKLVLKDRVGRRHRDVLDLSVIRRTDDRVTANYDETHIATSLGFEEVFDMLDIHGEEIHTETDKESCLHEEGIFMIKTEYT